MIKINTRKLLQILEITPHEQNIMLVGTHGIGKSQILCEYFSSKGFKVVSLFLGQMSDPGDLIGLPHKDEKTGTTEFLPPYWFPKDGKPIVLFLDELNRARPEVLQTIMDLALNKKIAGKKLPDGSRIISAVNYGDEYQLTDLDPALVSRFNIYEFVPSVEEWLLWAEKQNLDKRVTQFISSNTDMLDGLELRKEDAGLEKFPDRRGWERVAKILGDVKKAEQIHKELIAGIVGMKAAAKLFESFSDDKLLSAKEILTGDFKMCETIFKLYTLPNFAATNDSLFRYVETEKIPDAKKKLVFGNLEKYFDYLSKNGKREAMAHFANIYSDGMYPNAIASIIGECFGLYEKLTEFIASI